MMRGASGSEVGESNCGAGWGGRSPGLKVERPCVGRSGSGIRIQNVTVRLATLGQNRSSHCGEWETLNQGGSFYCGEEDPRSRGLGGGKAPL